MRTLIIPDIHHKWRRAQRVIDKVDHDEVVLLGDYFDDWGDRPSDILDTGNWLRGVFDAPTVVCLLGNHDVSYIAPQYRCSGWTAEKQSLFNLSGVSDLLRAKASLWHSTQGWWFSHAGLGIKFLESLPASEGAQPLAALETEPLVRDEFWYGVSVGVSTNVGAVSAVSGGGAAFDGPLWHRPSSAWFGDRYVGVPQVFGHTIVRTGKPVLVGDKGEYKELKGLIRPGGTRRVLLDTNLNHYAVIEDGVLRVFNAPE